MSNRFLTEQFAAWRDDGRDLVLVTVIDTAGSTYSKAGRQLLIDAAGEYAGLVGGGCLESDLILRARDVLANNSAQVASYDMRDDADDLWGMGLGCRGLMKLLLQPLKADDDWQPFNRIARAMQDVNTSIVELLIDSKGASQPTVELKLIADDRSDLPQMQTQQEAGGELTSLRWRIAPWPRLLVLGAGPDTHPVVAIARTLGWDVCVADQRSELLNAAGLDAADTLILLDSRDLDEQLDLGNFAAVCVMTHHLQSDQRYLETLSKIPLPYIGVLGPAARRAEILANLNLDDSAFAGQLRGPVGLDIGADTPQSIALALIAEIQATLAAHD